MFFTIDSAPHLIPWSTPSVFLLFSCSMALSRWPCPPAVGFSMTASRCVSVSMAFSNRVFYNRFCTSSKPIVIIVRCPCVSVSMAFSNRVFYNRFCTSFNPLVYSFSFPIVFLQYGPAPVAMSTSRRVHYDCVAVCLREHGLLKPCFLQ